MSRGIALVCLAAVVVAAAAGASWAGEISGKLLSPRGVGQSHIYSSCNITGTNPGGTGTFTTATSAPEGIFYHPNLPAGTYSQGLSEKDNYNVIYFKNLNVPASGNTWNVVQYQPTSFCFGTEWFYSWHGWYAQSFRATGENLMSIGLRVAGPDSGLVSVSVLDGDNPYASQIGPSRVLGVSSTNGQCAYWSAGEVPTVPGQMYTVRFTLEGGGLFSPWHQTVRERMRMEHPDGRTWAGGILIDEPLEMTVNQDDFGLINTMCCAKFTGYTVISSGGFGGQTFTAKGSSVLMVTWLTGSSTLWAVSIHDGPGSGSGGPQIGPTKYVNGVAWDGRAVVTWLPNEVPTVPGSTYYVKLRMANGDSCVIYNAFGGNEYAGGRAYNNGVALSYDYALGVYEEKYAGALDVPSVGINNFRVESITSNSAVVKWGTGRRGDSLVQYGETTPYSSSTYDSTSTLNHTITLTGLKANTMYHLRAMSRASGAKESFTRDTVFVTAPANADLVSDAGFEGGAFGTWVRYGTGDIRITGPWYAASGPRTGSYGLAGAISGGAIKGGAYQRVPAVAGWEYRLSAWLYTYTEGGNFSTKGYQALGRIGIDPTGGTDPNNAAIVWTPLTSSQDAWTQIGMSAVASSNYITVFLQGGNDNGILWSIFAFDDVVLTTTNDPATATLGSALRDRPDGSFVRIDDAVCSATSAQAGAYYIQTENRVNGIRAETGDPMSVGDRVSVIGTVHTRTTGERYLAGAVVVSRSVSTAPKALFLRPSLVGGKAPSQYCASVPGAEGLYNVGLLVRTSGKVTATASNAIFVNDGSMSGNGLRVRTNSLTSIPQIGQSVAVTGIVFLQGTLPSPSVSLRARSDADVRVFAHQ